MKPLSTTNREFPVPASQPRLRSPEGPPSDVEGSAAPIDRKTKKRIQNRVAQRTYRTRIKQRLQDLQQQVQTLQQKEEEQQREAQRGIQADDTGNEETTFPAQVRESFSPTYVQREEQPGPEIPCQDFHCIKTTNPPGPWAGMSSQSNTWNIPLGETRFVYDNSFNISGRPPVTTTSALSPTGLPLDSSGNVLYPHTSQAERFQSALPFSPGVEGNFRHHITNSANNTFEVNEEGRIGQAPGVNSSHLAPWLHKLELRSPVLDSTPVTAAKHSLYQDGAISPPMTAAPTQWPQNILPNTQPSVEEQFEYVLSCAQRVGFDSFDTMALHYYTRNFNPASIMGLQQHLSRDRRLPELLAELRKQSTNWSEWQRRGYQGETLKAAEEICAKEFGDFRKWEGANTGRHEIVNEEALGDMISSYPISGPS